MTAVNQINSPSEKLSLSVQIVCRAPVDRKVLEQFQESPDKLALFLELLPELKVLGIDLNGGVSRHFGRW